MGVLIFLAIIGVIIYLVTKESDSFSSSSHSDKSSSYYHTSTIHVNPRRNNETTRRIERWKRKRAEFEEQKKTVFFKDWKREQYYCQNKQCAWCRKNIELHSPDTHVDHIKPLMWWGTNEYTNLVLSCKECNEEKGDNTVGWAGGKHIPGENSKPTWIKPNRCCRNFRPKENKTSYTSGKYIAYQSNTSNERRYNAGF